MDAVLATRFAEIVAGERRARALPTLLAAAFVTALVVVPLVLRASGPADPEPADPGGVTVNDRGAAPLDGSTVTGLVTIVIDDPDVRAASFSLFAATSDDPVLSAQDLDGPTFSPVLDAAGEAQPLDTTQVDNGLYELFIVLDTPTGERRTAIGFEVQNP